MCFNGWPSAKLPEGLGAKAQQEASLSGQPAPSLIREPWKLSCSRRERERLEAAMEGRRQGAGLRPSGLRRKPSRRSRLLPAENEALERAETIP